MLILLLFTYYGLIRAHNIRHLCTSILYISERLLNYNLLYLIDANHGAGA